MPTVRGLTKYHLLRFLDEQVSNLSVFIGKVGLNYTRLSLRLFVGHNE